MFVALGDVVFPDDAGGQGRAPIRLSAVLRRDDSGTWPFAHFHGSIPTG